MINNLVAIAIELRCQGFLGDRKTDGIGNALPQRAGCGFDTSGIAVLRVPWGAAVQLTKVFDVIHGDVIAGQVQQRIVQHRAVPVGHHEAVTVCPLRICRIVNQIVVPEHLGNVCHAHWRARVAGVGLLNCIHTEGTNGIGKVFTG